jgi:hypothetical protein
MQVVNDGILIHMYKARSKRERRIRFFLTYTIVPVIIVSIAAALVLMIQGYRFDTDDQRVFQAGLVQFGSQPSGATISFDGENLASKTRARLNVSSGVHTIGMTLDGYVPWQKTVTVRPGKVLWLTYPRLVPETVTTESLYSYEAIAATLAHLDENLFAVQPDSAAPRLDVIRADNGDAERREASLPASLYSDVESGKWQAISWSKSSRYVLFRYDFEKRTRWYVLDREDTTRSFDITLESGLDDISRVEFDARDDRWLYLLQDGTLRRFDRDNLTLSRPIARDIVSLNQSEEGVISFVSRSDGLSRIGYVTPGAQSAKYVAIPAITNPRAAAISEYERRQYVASLSAAKLTIATTSLHASDSDNELELSKTFSVSLPKTTSSLSLSPEGRFIAARDGRTIHMYDLELNEMSQVSLPSKSAPLRWLSPFHVYSVVDGELVMQEFDGTNVTPIAPAVSAQAVFTPDGRYIYTVSKDETATRVVRMLLRTS